jgi:hypothetical protein
LSFTKNNDSTKKKKKKKKKKKRISRLPLMRRVPSDRNSIAKLTTPKRDPVSLRPAEVASYEDQFDELTHGEPGSASFAGTGTIHVPRCD